MTRAQFIYLFTEGRRRAYQQQIKAGTMRLSEAAMGLADARKDAIASWRKEPCRDVSMDEGRRAFRLDEP